jgi:hypothetical protein
VAATGRAPLAKLTRHLLFSALQPVHLHGSLGREAATGRGTVYAIREMLKATHAGKIQDHSFVIQVGLLGLVYLCHGLSWLLFALVMLKAQHAGPQLRDPGRSLGFIDLRLPSPCWLLLL